MRDKKDSRTIELPSLPKKRGRPPTGSAMSSAQRKAAQRLRDREVISWDCLVDASTTALCEQLPKKVSLGDLDLVKAVTLELMKRAKLASKAATVTKKTVAGAKPGKSKLVTVTKKTVASLKPGLR